MYREFATFLACSAMSRSVKFGAAGPQMKQIGATAARRRLAPPQSDALDQRCGEVMVIQDGELIERTEGVRRVGNVYFARFRDGMESGADELEETLAQIRDSVDSIAETARAIADDQAVLARLCNDSARDVAGVLRFFDRTGLENNLRALGEAIETSRGRVDRAEIARIASEIRDLVCTSAFATREMRALLRETVRRVQSGARVIDEVGASMFDIVQAIGQVTQVLDALQPSAGERAPIE